MLQRQGIPVGSCGSKGPGRESVCQSLRIPFLSMRWRMAHHTAVAELLVEDLPLAGLLSPKRANPLLFNFTLLRHKMTRS